MNVYRPKGSKTWRFAITLTVGVSRKQRVVNTHLTDKRAATELMRKTKMLAESNEAHLSLTPELRRWLDGMNPKVRKRLSDLGLIADADNAAATDIEQHVEDYLQEGVAEGQASDWLRTKRSQLKRLLGYTKAKRLSDITADAVAGFLAHLTTERGNSHRTRNQHRATTIAFLNWCVSRGRLEHHRVHTVPRMNEDLDPRHQRRAATDDEVGRLLAVMPERRRIIFLFAVLTGLRRGEIKRLERRDIDLNAKTIRVRATVGKSKKEDTIPLHADLVEMLGDHLRGMAATDLVFKPISRIETFRNDLKKAGIEYKDADDRRLDWHALRSTFATRLLRHGVHPSAAIRCTRHGSVKTLEKHYDKLGLDDARRHLDKLPGYKGNDKQR